MELKIGALYFGLDEENMKQEDIENSLSEMAKYYPSFQKLGEINIGSVWLYQDENFFLPCKNIALSFDIPFTIININRNKNFLFIIQAKDGYSTIGYINLYFDIDSFQGIRDIGYGVVLTIYGEKIN